MIFFRNDFPNSLIVRSRSIFLNLSMNIFDVRTFPALFFNSSSPSMILVTIDFFNFSDFYFYCFAVKVCVCVLSFVLLLGQFRDLSQ